MKYRLHNLMIALFLGTFAHRKFCQINFKYNQPQCFWKSGKADRSRFLQTMPKPTHTKKRVTVHVPRISLFRFVSLRFKDNRISLQPFLHSFFRLSQSERISEDKATILRAQWF